MTYRNKRIAAIVLALGGASLALGAAAQRDSAPRDSAHGSPSAHGPVSFLNDVEPILTHAGCNQGACHGSQFGKGGFKLSLAAYDPLFDHDNIVRYGKGRRISPSAPAASLLLRKAALQTPHSGGLKLPRGSTDYATIARWIQQGAPGPNASDPHIVGLDVLPAQSNLQPGAQVQLAIRARYSNGAVRDVTAHTRINSLDDKIAMVTPDGRAAAHERGATAVMLRYDGLATVSRILVPYAVAGAGTPIHPTVNSQTHNTRLQSDREGARRRKSIVNLDSSALVDAFIAKQWREIGLTPSDSCTDVEFIRRASLDIIGTLPAPEEVRTFLADRTQDKDALLIDRLLARPEYADYWAVKWGDLLRNSRAALGDKAMWSYRNWIRDQFVHNRPYNDFVHDLITAQGGAFAEPAANYYRVATTPQDLTESTAQVFLGVRLQCAKCHHHPFEKWSQIDYYQFAAFFARIGGKENREAGSAAVEPSVRLLATGDVAHPKTGARMTPTPLALQDGPALPRNAPDLDLAGDRRVLLADWLTGPKNRLFAKMAVNRYWGYFLGRGIVQPVDDMRVTNPPSNPELLDALAARFIADRYDLKRLIRTICASRAYRLSSRSTAANRPDEVFYSHFLERRQPAEVLLDSIDIAAGTHEKFNGLPLGTRAIQLPDASVACAFLDTFGRPPRTTSCECERAAEPSLSQSLQMLNGDTVNRKVTDPAGRIAKLIAAGKTDAEIIESVYFASLSRAPRSGERRTAAQAFASSASRRQAAEDLLWALINTREFGAIK